MNTLPQLPAPSLSLPLLRPFVFLVVPGATGSLSGSILPLDDMINQLKGFVVLIPDPDRAVGLRGHCRCCHRGVRLGEQRLVLLLWLWLEQIEFKGEIMN